MRNIQYHYIQTYRLLTHSIIKHSNSITVSSENSIDTGCRCDTQIMKVTVNGYWLKHFAARSVECGQKCRSRIGLVKTEHPPLQHFLLFMLQTLENVNITCMFNFLVFKYLYGNYGSKLAHATSTKRVVCALNTWLYNHVDYKILIKTFYFEYLKRLF